MLQSGADRARKTLETVQWWTDDDVVAAELSVRPPAAASETDVASASAPALRAEEIRTALLACGVAAPLVYLASDVIAGLRWDGYSFRDQTISELNANGSPVRSVTIALGFLGYSLLIAFGIGIWRAASGIRRLQLSGGALAVIGLSALWALPFASMNLRGTEQGVAGAKHLISGMIAIPLLIVAMGLAASTMGRLFRVYSIATVVVLLVFGAWAGARTTGMEEGLSSPWAGVIERISVYAYQLWIVVLAIALLWGRFLCTKITGRETRAE